MSGISHKIIICVAVDGLILQPLSFKGQKPFQPAKIKFGDSSISSTTRDQIPITASPESSFEALGIIGLISVSKLSYLITITGRQQVALILGHPIYVVTQVCITPCSSYTEAVESIRSTARYLRKDSSTDVSDDEGDKETTSDAGTEIPHDEHDDIEDDHGSEDGTRPRSASARSSIAEDVIRKKGSYGRFAQRWFSRSGWTMDQKRIMGMSNSPALQQAKTSDDEETNIPSDAVQNASNLIPKLLRTCQFFFGTSQSFYFSYDVDITRGIGKGGLFREDLPLHTQVENDFFWNQHLLKGFVEAGQDSLTLPVMQGFVGQRSFVVDTQPPQTDQNNRDSVELCNLSPTKASANSGKEKLPNENSTTKRRPTERAYLITVISRRSIKRAGLRYLRRGIDQNGFVANAIETEQILAPEDWADVSRIYSFVQIRGSIPLYFTQSPYSLKPVPALQHSEEVNLEAAQQHFERLAKAYGDLQAVNLVEKHGVEAKIGSKYAEVIEKINRPAQEGNQNSKSEHARTLSFEWFDFHNACRGMKFENVSLLLQKLKDTLERFNSTVQEGGSLVRTQKGVIRTNCMDCLDRTNVCQSSFARHMLEFQLREEDIDLSAQLDQQTTWFNTLWADNGDAISKQYASTAAMKGDYTRTRKRNYRGALNDLGLSLARFYSGMVNDYFSQTAIDFLLGNVTEQVFDEFESEMMTKDPAISMPKRRQQAIELCQRRVIADEREEYQGGWVLLSPSSPDTVRSLSMEEVVLLLTDAAAYLCRFDWNLEKVSAFERVALASIVSIKAGTYITSTISPSHINEERNVGFVINYQPGKSDIRRRNTRTFSNVGDLGSQVEETTDGEMTHPTSWMSWMTNPSQGPPVTRKLAFKIPYLDSFVSVTGSGPIQTEKEQLDNISADLDRLALQLRLYKEGEAKKSILQRDNIISLEEAKRNTGLFEQLGHSIKKLVWA